MGHSQENNPMTNITIPQSLENEICSTDNHTKRRSASSDVRCSAYQIACGKMIFAGSDKALTFSQQSCCKVTGSTNFGPFLMVMNIAGNVRMNISYDVIQGFIVDSASHSFIIILRDPPKFFMKTEDGPMGSWSRQNNVLGWTNHAKYVAHCLAHRIWVLEGGFDQAVRALASKIGLLIACHNFPVICNATEENEFGSCLQAFEHKLQQVSIEEGLIPFGVLFQVQALVWNNYLHPSSGSEMLDEICRLFSDAAHYSPPLTTVSMQQLFQTTPYPSPNVPASTFVTHELLRPVIYSEKMFRATQERISQHLTHADRQSSVLKAIITPSRILLRGPEKESKNRVLRMFPEMTEHFLRVTFCDEDGQDLSLHPRISNDEVFVRYRKVLRYGITVAGRKFHFLGFSHSSLRSHSTWFASSFVDERLAHQDCKSILKLLGDFRDIRIPAKCAARIGQAFSETPFAVPISQRNIRIRYIEDVKNDSGSRVFSDGVGTISFEALQEVWECLPNRLGQPTCIQIRIAGIKGMLSLDARLSGKVICIRKESMMKFPSDDTAVLGICDVGSRPLRFVLNRQTIKILEDMGISDEWFITLQNNAIDDLRQAASSAPNASRFLEYRGIGTSFGLPSFVKQLHNFGIDYRGDGFLRSVVCDSVLSEIQLLKYKARIPVSKGVTLFGVMDETAFLRDGQVYVTYDAASGTDSGGIESSLTDGRVLITRSPALHPGDIQYVEMVTPPKGHPLLQLRNCIVFSQKGSRDLPSKLSGGDLDGDLYSIIWDPDAVPKQHFEPADYPRANPEPLDREVTQEDMADFFIDFMKSDVLGLIANRHQIYADMRDAGTTDPECINLAEMHSSAVDYSKTGVPVEAHRIPKAPQTRPDFLAPAPAVVLVGRGKTTNSEELVTLDTAAEESMNRSKHSYYRSRKILGRLFRGIDERKIWNENIKGNMIISGLPLWDELFRHIKARLNEMNIILDYECKLEAAKKIRILYDAAVIDNMWHFSEHPREHLSEVEVFCGSNLNSVRRQTRRQRDSFKKLAEKMDEDISWITGLMHGCDKGYDASSKTILNEKDDELQRRLNVINMCLACVVVGGDDVIPSVNDRSNVELKSFRVVAASCLFQELASFRRP